MKSLELKSIQEPLKNKYKSDPGAALITLKAKSRLGNGVTCKIETGKAMVEAGLHPATGGNGLSACSGDMLLEALAACAGVTLNAVATAFKVTPAQATAIDFPLKDASIYVEGDLDFRGTLSIDREAPVGFKNIRMRFDLETDADAERVSKLIKLTERYCVVLQTLARGNDVAVTVSCEGVG